MTTAEKTVESIPEFTIIVPVIHSLGDLDRCLSSLDSLDYPKDHFQVVLMHCHVVYGVEQFLTENLPKYRFRANYLELPEHPPTKLSWFIESRLNEARNYAIEKVPGRYYVFTIDDCTFEPDWLNKIEDALTDGVSALGGPDLLPHGMGWFPRSVDCILNSYLGTAGLRRGGGRRAHQYHPRKENMAIPAWVLDNVGKFPEEKPIGGEMEMAKRIRDAGLKIRFLPDNPVWHRRVTTFRNFLRLRVFMACEKVRLLRQQRCFIPSPAFLLLVATISGLVLGLFSAVSNYARTILAGLVFVYVLALFGCALWSAVRTSSVSVCFGVLLLMPAHHLSLSFGTLKGAFVRIKSDKG